MMIILHVNNIYQMWLKKYKFKIRQQKWLLVTYSLLVVT